jgi:hypothetical protein
MEVNMKTQKVLLKTAYCLVGLSILVLIGLSIFQHQQIKKLSENAVPDTITKDESTGDPMSAPVEMVQKSVAKSTGPVSKEKESYTGEINELEYQLDAAEEELDMTNEQLSDELSKKRRLKEAAAQLQKNMLSDPALKKVMRDALRQNLDRNYDPLSKLLNISTENFNELKDLLVDRMMEFEDMSTLILEASSVDEKAEINQRMEEIRNKYDNNIREFLGDEKNKIFQSYNNSLSERSNLNGFMESLSPENRINEDQAEILIKSMYETRKMVQAEMGPDEDIRFPSDLNEEAIARQMEVSKKAYEKYTEVSRNILPPAQVEQFKAFLKQRLDMTESSLKISSQLYGGKTDQKSDEKMSE